MGKKGKEKGGGGGGGKGGEGKEEKKEVKLDMDHFLHDGDVCFILFFIFFFFFFLILPLSLSLPPLQGDFLGGLKSDFSSVEMGVDLVKLDDPVTEICPVSFPSGIVIRQVINIYNRYNYVSVSKIKSKLVSTSVYSLFFLKFYFSFPFLILPLSLPSLALFSPPLFLSP